MPMPEVCHGVPAPEALTGAPQVCTAGDVKNLNMNKEVATRLFRMLAVNETTVNSVKRDAASYARLSLLTQQMGLVQQQARPFGMIRGPQVLVQGGPVEERRGCAVRVYVHAARRVGAQRKLI